jgi:tetratricopeptide (TPR) repeat protein
MASSARIDELRKKFDENPRRYFAPLANEYRKSGDPEQAIFICREYLPQQPGHMSGHIVYGQALFELSRFEESRAVFETALSLDPENLIALRHLGDIARQAGDMSAARIWYHRVLEADPRNDEIAQIMMDLLANPVVGQSAVRTAPVVPPPPREPAVPPDQPPFPAEAPVSTWGEAPPPSEDEDLRDLEDLSVGGVPLASLSAPPPLIEPLTPPPNAASDMPSEHADEGKYETDPFAIAASANSVSAVEPPIDLATDIDLGLRDDGQSATTFSEERGEQLADLETHGETLEGAEATGASEPAALEVDAFLAGMSRETEPFVEQAPEVLGFESQQTESHSASPDAPHATIETPGSLEATAPTKMEPEAPVETPLWTPPETQTPSAPFEEFVTETMAELYLEQGHPEAAVDIYQRLVAQRPDDPELVYRLRSLEATLHVEPVAGPNIREFLVGLLSGVAVSLAAATPAVDMAAISPNAPHALDIALGDENEPSVAEPTEATIEDDFGVALVEPSLDGVVDEPSAAVPVRLETPGTSETVSGSIDALFSGTGSSTADVDAAATLSQAFAEETSESMPAPPLPGVPAHAAKSELSLDHVFKTTPSRRHEDAASDGFSFDRFFAEELNDTGQKGGSEPPNTPGKGAGPGDDIAQFKNWLNALKKT